MQCNLIYSNLHDESTITREISFRLHVQKATENGKRRRRQRSDEPLCRESGQVAHGPRCMGLRDKHIQPHQRVQQIGELHTHQCREDSHFHGRPGQAGRAQVRETK